jgi:hypothetical protein
MVDKAVPRGCSERSGEEVYAKLRLNRSLQSMRADKFLASAGLMTWSV